MGDVIDFEAYREERRQRAQEPKKGEPRRVPRQGSIEPAPSLPKPQHNPCKAEDQPAN